jgi:hypothetical protein
VEEVAEEAVVAVDAEAEALAVLAAMVALLSTR